MPAKPPAPRPLPGALLLAASLFVAFHLFALVVLVLSAPSGPWPTPFGMSQALGPPFAGRVSEVTTRYYLTPLRMTHNYHFLSNRPDVPDVAFEVKLKDESGAVRETLYFPPSKDQPRRDGSAWLYDNPWLHQRYVLLAQALGDDEPVAPPRGEEIAAPGKQASRVKVWKMDGPRSASLREVESHLLKDLFKEQPEVYRPREWSLLLARAYLRHLAREQGAATAELVRSRRQPIMPALLFLEQAPPGTFDTQTSTFEEYHREQ